MSEMFGLSAAHDIGYKEGCTIGFILGIAVGVSITTLITLICMRIWG